MTKKRNNVDNNNASSSNDDEIALLKERLKKVENQVTSMKDENKLLVAQIRVLEDQVAVAMNTSDRLKLEVDRLDQYQRRYNVVLKNVALPKKPTQEGDEKFVNNLFVKEPKLPGAYEEVDKLHRLGSVRTNDGGKKTQDIIVRFKTHEARYKVYDERKKSKSTKIRPNLTRRRGQLLHQASKLVEDVDQVHFVFANDHGDLKLRLKNKTADDKQYFDFKSMEDLKETLRGLDFDFVDDVEGDDA